MTYIQKLRSPLWQKKRLHILERDNWSCCACGDAERNLQVHHIIYAKRDPWDYPDEVLQTLCEKCHELRQQLTDKAVDALRIAIKDTPTDQLEKTASRLMEKAMERL